MKKFEVNGIQLVVTPCGIKQIRDYLAHMQEKRDDLVGTGKDLDTETPIPTIDDVIKDIRKRYRMHRVQVYSYVWKVTDNYYADYSLSLVLGRDIIYEEAADAISKYDEAKRLWKDFHDNAIFTKTMVLYQPWGDFSEGTSAAEIRKWFEETFDVSVDEDLEEKKGIIKSHATLEFYLRYLINRDGNPNLSLEIAESILDSTPTRENVLVTAKENGYSDFVEALENGSLDAEDIFQFVNVLTDDYTVSQASCGTNLVVFTVDFTLDVSALMENHTNR